VGARGRQGGGERRKKKPGGGRKEIQALEEKIPLLNDISPAEGGTLARERLQPSFRASPGRINE